MVCRLVRTSVPTSPQKYLQSSPLVWYLFSPVCPSPKTEKSVLLVTSKKDELFVAGKMRSHLTYPGNCTCGRKELMLLHFESYHHELNDIFHSLIAIAALPCWKLSTLGHMNVSYMHIYIYLYLYLYISSSTSPSAKQILRDFRTAAQIK